MADVLLLNELQDFLRIKLAQADVGAANGRHSPGEAPAVAMKHRQHPEIIRTVVHGQFNHFTYSIKIGAAMVVHYTFRSSRGAGCIVDGNGLIFVFDQDGQRFRTAGLQKRLVAHALEGHVIDPVEDIDNNRAGLQLIFDRDN